MKLDRQSSHLPCRSIVGFCPHLIGSERDMKKCLGWHFDSERRASYACKGIASGECIEIQTCISPFFVPIPPYFPSKCIKLKKKN